LYCSALLGRLDKPYREGTPNITLADGTHVYTNIALLVASVSSGRGTVLESGNVDVVLSPDAFDHWSRSGVGYRIAVANRENGQFVPIVGSNWFADPGWSIGEGFRTANGVLYRSQCSRLNPLCVTTAEKLTDVWAGSRATQTAYAGMGGAAGLGFGLALALLHLRTEGLRHQLRRALRRNSSSLRTVYEPILDVTSGLCVGAEVLTRWSDQDGAPISPDVFVRLAEESGFVGELTAWVLCRATGELGATLRKHPEFALSINVAAADINGDALLEALDQHVRQAGIDPRQIILELTERSTADLTHLRHSIQRLAVQGFQVHVDDFGTGFSSLAYLDQLAVHAIKVDRCFTRTIGTDAVTVSILPQMLAMAESLHLEVVVEGVETEAQLHYLQTTRRPLRVQGWYFSRPMSAEELFLFLERIAAEARNRNSQRPGVAADSAPADIGAIPDRLISA
jgi:sensor c-di-GMP phosphodiesterase-like protein